MEMFMQGLPSLPPLAGLGNVGAASSLGAKGAVLVRGFDFGTTAEQITGHMSTVGTVENVKWADIGAVCVTYSSAQEAAAAVANLQQTTIPGNTRYIDVIILDPATFLADHNIDTEQAKRFFAMPPEQQQAVMAKGSLATARDPTAVLVQRMKQVKMEATAKGLNPAGAAGDVGSAIAGGGAVLVRGFDFGTSDEQIAAHMATVGSIVSVQWVDEGSRCATYSTAEEAKAAAAQLQQTTIAGNSRYIDVILMDPEAFLAGHAIETDKAMQFLGMTPQQQTAVMAKGSLATARDPTAVLIQRMKQCLGAGPAAGAKGFLSKGGASSALAGPRAGTGSVMVRGFDFGTTDEQIVAHMSTAGNVENIQSIDGWCRCVTYSSVEEAKAAALHLQQSIIPGNTRYIDVLLMDPVAFVSEHDIDPAQRMQFLAMAPEQQHAVIAKGGLSTARDPTAVLIQRMKAVQGIGKGPFGPAGVGGMACGKGAGPYSGGKGGFMEKGGKGAGKGGKLAMLMKLVQMMGGMGDGN
eukprot:TRINITY_DN2800_c0_g2_i1.p1 TRINITY_DN2800_c0_g2~~TRINITY_DN2800_c0_g2_i1.p1  ORF type:complete len:531 (-),score=116.89 TRINITY_DN2800_c0_g2_i1:496-2061(-)